MVCRNELYQALELDLFDKAIKWQPAHDKNSCPGVIESDTHTNVYLSERNTTCEGVDQLSGSS